jgi:hypothetical protein
MAGSEAVVAEIQAALAAKESEFERLKEKTKTYAEKTKAAFVAETQRREEAEGKLAGLKVKAKEYADKMKAELAVERQRREEVETRLSAEPPVEGQQMNGGDGVRVRQPF